MPSSNLPPEEQPEVKPFDPLVLDRTVIAVPLLNEMKEDLSLIETVEKMYPEAAQKFNAAIEFNKKFPGGVKAAREKVLTMAEDAKQAALETSKRRRSRLTCMTPDRKSTSRKTDQTVSICSRGWKLVPFKNWLFWIWRRRGPRLGSATRRLKMRGPMRGSIRPSPGRFFTSGQTSRSPDISISPSRRSKRMLRRTHSPHRA